jgi:hypothetical protein
MNHEMRHGQKVYVDEKGLEYCLDEMGNKIIPMNSKVIGESSGWKEYDSRQGHCGLCGRISCRGYCVQGGN